MRWLGRWSRIWLIDFTMRSLRLDWSFSNRDDDLLRKSMKTDNKLRELVFTAKPRQDPNATAKLGSLIFDLLNELEVLDRPPAVMTPPPFVGNGDQVSFFDEVSRFEIALIRNALHHSDGRQVHAARLLNLSVSTLNTKIKQYGIKTVVHHYQPQTGTTAAMAKRKK